ncbi:MAG: hypothetical protein WB974_05715, partial [Acidobacteriaceae bacterium]
MASMPHAPSFLPGSAGCAARIDYGLYELHFGKSVYGIQEQEDRVARSSASLRMTIISLIVGQHAGLFRGAQ